MTASTPRDEPLIDHLLGELQAVIMRLMWERHTATVREIFEVLNAAGRSSAYTTVMTVMARLAEKGLLARERAGKMHVYHSTTTQEGFLRQTAAKRVQQLVEDFGDLAMAQFLVEVTELDPERRRQLARLADEE